MNNYLFVLPAQRARHMPRPIRQFLAPSRPMWRVSRCFGTDRPPPAARVTMCSWPPADSAAGSRPRRSRPPSIAWSRKATFRAAVDDARGARALARHPWPSKGITAQVVLIPTTGERKSRQRDHHAAHAAEPFRTTARTSRAMAWCARTVGVCHGLKGSQPRCWEAATQAGHRVA
jgi:hypothetical protein